ncbi:hypothetical protein [Alsobacter sp. R-9]
MRSASPSSDTAFSEASTRRGPLAGAVAATLLLALVPAALAASPRAMQPVAVVGLADSEPERIAAIGEAGGTVMQAPGRRVTIAMPGDEGFIGRLRAKGYWIVLDGAAVAACWPGQQGKARQDMS